MAGDFSQRRAERRDVVRRIASDRLAAEAEDDVLVLELGANDGLRGIDPVLTESNLLEMVARTRKTYPECDVVIAGMQIPTNLGQDYTEAFRSVFPSVADSTGSVLIPFLLEGVGGVAELNLPDGKHPTAEGHQIVADNVWDVLQPLLEERIRVSDRADGDP